MGNVSRSSHYFISSSGGKDGPSSKSYRTYIDSLQLSSCQNYQVYVCLLPGHRIDYLDHRAATCHLSQGEYDMNEEAIKALIDKQRAFFKSGATRDISFRKGQLRTLKEALCRYEKDIVQAVYDDLRRPATEAYFGETLFLESEINYTLKHLHRWVKTRHVATPLMHSPGRSEILPEPYGVALVLAPWNYPFLLLLDPLVGIIAAGNCGVLKPSELAPASSALALSMVSEYFDSAYIAGVEGGIDESKTLLAQKFDYIFYTGSTAVGRMVMEAAAKNLTPVTLELGGKSPCIVDRNLHMKNTCRRVAWGKFFNAGQTCTAPDYVLVHKDCAREFIDGLTEEIKSFYGDDPRTSPHFGRIINDRHFLRLRALLKSGRVVSGGMLEQESLYIAPTILDEVAWESPIMEEEIFGPLLPVIIYNDSEEALAKINEKPKPLALYLFTEDESLQQRVIDETTSGGVCINDTIVHIATTSLPFGGVGDSGMGAYHGKASFDTFSHMKSIMRRGLALDPPLRYPPYRELTPLFKTLIKELV
jgi:aldehyde dehydrogenase (NAD+)